MRSRRRSAPASAPPRSAAPASSSASAPSAKAPAKPLDPAVSVAEAADRPAHAGRAAVLWLGFLLIIAAGLGLAWIGAGSLRPVISESGLQFRTIKAGAGEPIARNDAALLDYILTADDGSVLDSSETHGGPQP